MELTRRSFVMGASAAALAAAFPATAAEPRRYKLAVGYGMIGIKGTVLEKLQLLKDVGFDGVEINSPGSLKREEALEARDKTGIAIHGVVDSIHWGTRMSDPDPAVREKGLKGLLAAMDEAKFLGADAVLLVPGAVKNKETENFEQVWQRSQEQIRLAIPTAEKLGVKIAIEVVWNDFLTTPQQLIQYVDEFKNPIVGAYFDAGNMVKYGVPPATWIRLLGKRMVKLHLKSYSMTRKWVAIGDGDENYPDVAKALVEVGYNGWATAEVGGGDAAVLKDVKQRMEKALGM